MSDFKYLIDEYKQRAHNKQNNIKDSIIYAIARAVHYGESDGETNYLAGKYLFRAFKPVTNKKTLQYQLCGDSYHTVKRELIEIAFGMYGDLYKACDETTQDKIRTMAKHLVDVVRRNYVYVFVREDLECKEQAVVQAAHATFVAGHKIRTDILSGAIKCDNFEPQNTHFVVCGMCDVIELEDQWGRIEDGGYTVYPFFEEDIGNEMTAFAVQPVQQADRHFFKQYQLLKFNRKEG